MQLRSPPLACRGRSGICPLLRQTCRQQQSALDGCRPLGSQQLPARSQHPCCRAAPSAAEAAPCQELSASTGLGVRGANIAGRVLRGSDPATTEAWHIDAGGSCDELDVPLNTLILDSPQGAGGRSAEQQFQAMIGPGAADKGGRGNINTGDGGLAFIIATASSIPGGPETLLTLVRSLRSAGIFTSVAIATPFEFEGARRVTAAAALVAELREAAHLVTVVDQNVLLTARTSASGVPMTAVEATGIADNALEHTVRCLLTATQATEFLKSARGALAWHGTEMRRFKRLLAPPLQPLLESPGQGALGRGAAAMSADLRARLGHGQTLMRLASDAVRAAADSPFLEHIVGEARTVLCCVSLPAGGLRAARASHGPQSPQALARLAVQAAAGTVMQICPCEELVMCYSEQSQMDEGERDSMGSTQLGVEVSLLVLSHSGRAAPRTPSTRPAASPLPQRTTVISGAAASTSTALPPVPRTKQMASPARTPRTPSSSWQAMSAIAGGSKRAAPGKPPRPQSPGTSKPTVARELAPAAAASTPPPRSVRQERPMPADSAAVAGEEGDDSVGDKLAESLIAQSLDLPPKAAKWRQHQRAKSERPRLMVQAPEAAWQSGDEEDVGLTATLRSLMGASPQEFDIRARTSAILERDRGDALLRAEEED